VIAAGESVAVWIGSATAVMRFDMSERKVVEIRFPQARVITGRYRTGRRAQDQAQVPVRVQA
jgi:hypothetical protein